MEVPYTCSHSLGGDVLGRTKVPKSEADLVVLLVGGEALPSELLKQLAALGVSASLGAQPGLNAKSDSKFSEQHLHLANVDVVLFDSVRIEALSATLKGLKDRTQELHSFEGVFGGQRFAMTPDGRIGFVGSQKGDQTPVRSPYGEGTNFVRLFGKGIVNPKALEEVGVPGLALGKARASSIQYPDPQTEFELRGKLRPVVWECDRLFHTFGAVCETLGPEQANALRQRTVGAQPALSRLSSDWKEILWAFLKYRLDVLKVLDSVSSNKEAAAQGVASPSKIAEWGLISVSELASAQRRFGRFISMTPALAAEIDAQRLGKRFIDYSLGLEGALPRMSEEARGVLLGLAEAEAAAGRVSPRNLTFIRERWQGK
jgi:hypothetical protein